MKRLIQTFVKRTATRVFTGLGASVATLGVTAAQWQVLEAAGAVVAGLLADWIVRELLGGD